MICLFLTCERCYARLISASCVHVTLKELCQYVTVVASGSIRFALQMLVNASVFVPMCVWKERLFSSLHFFDVSMLWDTYWWFHLVYCGLDTGKVPAYRTVEHSLDGTKCSNMQITLSQCNCLEV